MKSNRFGLRLVSAVLLLCMGLCACTGGHTPADTTPDTAETGTAVGDTTSATEPGTTAPPTEPPVTEVPTEPAETEPPIIDVMVGDTLDAPYAADFRVSNVFASDMVVQRGEHIRVWGWADATENGKKVSGEFKGMFAEAIVEDGAWEITFGARLEASAELGHSMRIYTDTKEVVFDDVLVGDVYMVIGQSNVAYSVGNHVQNSSGAVDALDYDLPIRLHYNSLTQTAGYPRRGTEEVCEEVRSGSTWQRADSYSDIVNFTAIGYYFACQYQKLTNSRVPIGLIEIDGNGQPLGAFLCNQAAEANRTDMFNSTKGYYVTSGINADAGRYLYNHYMFPFERYAIAGVIWYQGESDMLTPNVRKYVQSFSDLMTYMRSTHNLVHPEFPVYFVEFPTGYPAPAGATQWSYMDFALIRGVMGSIPQTLPNSYQAVSCDLWTDSSYWNTLHPNCKYEQAERLALLASAVLGEGKTMPESAGPVLVSMEVSADGKTAVLTYDNVGEGLTTSDGGTDVRGFALYRKGFSVNTEAKLTATITAPNQITVKSPVRITGIAYNPQTSNLFGNEINLCNSYDMPAGATVMLAD